MTKIFGQEDIGTDIAAVQAEVDNIDGDAMRGTDSAALSSVWTAARGSYLEYIGSGVLGIAVTAVLLVSPNGDDSDGSTWAKAYTTIQGALDAASTDANDLTLILIAPQTSAQNYDINTDGDPTWSANVILQGSHRNWVKIKNTHASATSIMKLTGHGAVECLNFNLGTGSANGLQMVGGGFRVDDCMFVGEDITRAATALLLGDGGTTVKHGKVRNCDFRGDGTNMKGIYLNKASCIEMNTLRIGYCDTGIQQVDADSDNSLLANTDLCSCVLGLDIDAGNYFQGNEVHFIGNTTNIEDEVGDALWWDLHGHFPVVIEPNDLTGITVNTGGAEAWGSDTELRAAATSTKPFRVIGVSLQPSTSEWYQVRFSADSGSSFYDKVQFDGTKRMGLAGPAGTEYLFNVGTRISASARDIGGGDVVKVWLEIQEI